MKHFLLVIALTFSALSFSQTVEDPSLDITEAIEVRLSTNDWFMISVKTNDLLIKSHDREIRIESELSSLRLHYLGNEINLTNIEKSKIKKLCDNFIKRINDEREAARFKRQIELREYLITENKDSLN